MCDSCVATTLELKRLLLIFCLAFEFVLPHSESRVHFRHNFDFVVCYGLLKKKRMLPLFCCINATFLDLVLQLFSHGNTVQLILLNIMTRVSWEYNVHFCLKNKYISPPKNPFRALILI